jgi:small-conductance mechanosensitive channel
MQQHSLFMDGNLKRMCGSPHSDFRSPVGMLWQCAALVVLCVCLLPGYLRAQEPLPAIDTGVPVRFHGKVLFSVYTPLGALQPHERADVVVARLQRLADDATFPPETVAVTDLADRTEIVADGITIATVTAGDAQAADLPRASLAQTEAAAIRRAITDYRRERSAQSVAIGLLYSLIATVVLVAVVVMIGRLANRAHRRLVGLRRPRDTVSNARAINGYLVSHFVQPLVQLILFLCVAVTLALVYAYVVLVCYLFPWTRDYGATLAGYIQGHLVALGSAFLGKLPDLLFIGIILLIASFVLKTAYVFFTGIEDGTITFTGLDPELAPPTFRIARILIFILAAVAIFPYVPGFSSPAFQGVSVFIGALITLGSSSVIANLFAGIMLTYMRPFRVGDRVKIGEALGEVTAKSDMATRIRTPRNVEITIPNSQVLGVHMINYSALARTQGLILHTGVTIGYDVPWRQVHALLLAAARSTEMVLPEPAPFVLQTALNDFYVAYEINVYTDQPNLMATTYSELHQNILDRFSEAGVEIMSPHYTALRDGNPTTIPIGSRPPQ